MTTLAHLINSDMQKAWSFADIARSVRGRVKGLKMKYIDQENFRQQWTPGNVFGSHNVVAILLTVVVPGEKRKQKHWVCLLKLKNKGASDTYQFFDSLNLEWPVLSEMLRDNGKFVQFLKKIKARPSTKQLQKEISDVRTCGAWVVCRSAFGVAYNLTNSQFVHFILSEKGSSPDRTCIKLCALGMLT